MTTTIDNIYNELKKYFEQSVKTCENDNGTILLNCDASLTTIVFKVTYIIKGNDITIKPHSPNIFLYNADKSLELTDNNMQDILDLIALVKTKKELFINYLNNIETVYANVKIDMSKFE